MMPSYPPIHTRPSSTFRPSTYRGNDGEWSFVHQKVVIIMAEVVGDPGIEFASRATAGIEGGESGDNEDLLPGPLRIRAVWRDNAVVSRLRLIRNSSVITMEVSLSIPSVSNRT